MILKTIKFDKNNIHWEDDEEYNHMYLMMAECHMNDFIRHRGYIYLNQICEELGVRWNPDDENPCVRNDGSFVRLWLSSKSDDNSILIHILKCS